MEESKGKALVPFSTSGSGIVETGPRSIVATMVKETLALAQSQATALAAARFRIGEHEFCDPDYRQLLIWAKSLRLEPTMLLQTLEKSSVFDFQGLLKFKNGAIVTLGWNFDVLPIDDFQWVEGLTIKTLIFKGQGYATAELNLRLPTLERLECSSLGLIRLDLSGVSQLAFLNCLDNKLTELDLSSVPFLLELDCSMNQLVELDVSNMRRLRHFNCHDNSITTLNLINTPELNVLWCSWNCLKDIDLKSKPNLTTLLCEKNRFSTLDLSSVPMLDELLCSNNLLDELDLRNVPKLTLLECSGNQLHQMDLSNVPKLGALLCANNRIVSLDLRCVTSLVNLDCSGNQLAELDVSPVLDLQKLLCHDNQLTHLDFSRNHRLSTISCRDNDLSDHDLEKLKEATAAWIFKGDLCSRDVTFYVGRTDFLTDVAKL